MTKTLEEKLKDIENKIKILESQKRELNEKIKEKNKNLRIKELLEIGILLEKRGIKTSEEVEKFLIKYQKNNEQKN